MDHSERQDVFDALNLADPEAFVFLGNTVDVDAGDMDDMLEAYEVLNRFRGPQFTASTVGRDGGVESYGLPN